MDYSAAVQTILILDDDRILAEGIAAVLETPGRRSVICRDLEAAQLILDTEVLAAVITDVRLSGPFRFEGLDFVRDARRRLPRGPIILMTGVLSDGMEAEARARGATEVLEKPFAVASLEALLPAPDSSAGEETTVLVPSLDEVIDGTLLTPAFQPIVDIALSPERPHGYEALARFHGPFFTNPALLFDYAARLGRLNELELACMRQAFSIGAPLTAAARLFINVHPHAITTGNLAEMVANAAADSGIAPQSVVLEITEQGSLGPSSVVEEQCGALRELGFSFALDDVGMAYSHLTHIEQIRPAYLKISQEFGTDFEVHAARTKIVRNILSLARDFGCELILEGIESAATREAARDLGLHLCQGYFFARPAAVGTLMSPES
jgi:EAL domain-containing protein (putative c-di-GMP-specific phosphodiesterase class I)